MEKYPRYVLSVKYLLIPFRPFDKVNQVVTIVVKLPNEDFCQSAELYHSHGFIRPPQLLLGNQAIPILVHSTEILPYLLFAGVPRVPPQVLSHVPLVVSVEVGPVKVLCRSPLHDVFLVTFLLMRGPQLCPCDGLVAVLVHGAEVVEPQVGLPEEDLFFSDMTIPVQVVGLGDIAFGVRER